MDYLTVFLTSILPIAELRGSIPLGILVLKLPVVPVLLISVVGNSLVAALIILVLEPIARFTRSRWNLADRLLSRLFQFTQARHSEKFARSKELALLILVAIPLPLTGGWTGALCAYVFGIPKPRAIALVAAGVAIAGMIVTALTVSGRTLL